MLLNTKSKVARVGKVFSPKLVFLDLQATLKAEREQQSAKQSKTRGNDSGARCMRA